MFAKIGLTGYSKPDIVKIVVYMKLLTNTFGGYVMPIRVLPARSTVMF
ncbi:hypothetical protein SAMN05216564_11710 [Halopenitus persicus]|uniref:Uncharacterized protein n=1 Tax=Halopenitus persicus TaxID=1048396 RepID=A0A1H3NZI6_9EURY|nr:hypothetical protein SAMN05216564_11710 [Halopenitus persicus]